jgi:hypothetical protein
VQFPLVPTAGQNFYFFRDIQGKEKNATNFSRPRQLEAGEEMVITRLGFHIPLASGNVITLGDDFKKILENLYLKWEVNGFTIGEGLAIQFPSGMGIAGNTVENNDCVMANGVPSLAAAYELKEPQHITENHTVLCTATLFGNTWPTVAVAMPVITQVMFGRAMLYGLIKSASTK